MLVFLVGQSNSKAMQAAAAAFGLDLHHNKQAQYAQQAYIQMLSSNSAHDSKQKHSRQA